MATFKNESEQTLVFPSLSVVAEPGDTFDTDADITTAGVVAVTGKKKADPAPVADAPAPAEAPAPVEEVK